MMLVASFIDKLLQKCTFNTILKIASIAHISNLPSAASVGVLVVAKSKEDAPDSIYVICRYLCKYFKYHLKSYL